MKALLVDAYDSFIYIIEQYLKTIGLDTVTLRCDHPDLRNLILSSDIDFVVLGPGPGRPEEAGYLDLVDLTNGQVPVLGICLGHQAIGMAYGAKVSRAAQLMHGKTSKIINDGKGVFSHTFGQPFTACRYHSLAIEPTDFPADLIITATSKEDGCVMGVRHRILPIEGIQFHPESIATDNGLMILESFLTSYLSHRSKAKIV